MVSDEYINAISKKKGPNLRFKMKVLISEHWYANWSSTDMQVYWRSFVRFYD